MQDDHHDHHGGGHDPVPPDGPHGGRPDDDPAGPGADVLVREFPIPDFGRGETRDRYTPFLVLRHGPGDDGGRPLPAGTVFWHSPDVWVTSSLGINLPVAGQPAKPFARVTNLGMQDAAGVVVRWWWADPSLAITPANAHPIGTTTAFVPSGYSVVVPCPEDWVPVMENGGHECIVAEAFLPDADPLGTALDPVADRHVCQKNLHVIQVAAGAEFSFGVGAANPAGAARRVEVHARALSFGEVRRALTAPDVGWREPLVETPEPMALRMAWAGPGQGAPAGSPAGPGGAAGVAGGVLGWLPRLVLRILRFLARLMGLAWPSTPAPPAGGAVMADGFGPGEARGVELRGRVPPGATPRQAFGFHVHERLDGQEVTGGYTLYVVVR